jgi:hypothetical protein
MVALEALTPEAGATGQVYLAPQRASLLLEVEAVLGLECMGQAGRE